VSVYRHISGERAHCYPVSLMCELLTVSESGYWAWLKRPPSDRELTDAWLTERIRAIHEASSGRYGSPRVHAVLRREGIRVGEKRVARLMALAGLQGAHQRRRRKGCTVRVEGVEPFGDLVGRDFRPDAPDRVWAADIKQIKTGEGWLYLAAVQDLFSRRIVGWAMAEHMRAELVVDALKMAVRRRRPARGTIHHSDHGGQPGLNRSSQQCVREMNLGAAGDGSTGVRRGDSVGVARLSSRRLARRAGRSGDSRVRAVRGPVVGAAGVTVFGRGDSDPSP
jgi:putative transposase